MGIIVLGKNIISFVKGMRMQQFQTIEQGKFDAKVRHL